MEGSKFVKLVSKTPNPLVFTPIDTSVLFFEKTVTILICIFAVINEVTTVTP